MTYRASLVLALVFAPMLAAQSAPAASLKLTPAEMREEIAYFRDNVLGADHSYSSAARAQAAARLDQLAKHAESVTTVTTVAFELALAQIVALADNGHTLAIPAIRSGHWNRVPIRLVSFGGEFAVTRAKDAYADLLGARLTAIDGRPVRELRDSARTLAGGVAARRDQFAPALLESPEQLHALGMARDAAQARYTFVALDGRTIDRTIVAEPAAGMDFAALGAPLLVGESPSWRTLLPPAKVPWSLMDPGTPFRWRAAPEIDAIVIDLRQTIDASGYSLTDFLNQMTEKIGATHPRNLVLDMRTNSGGNLQLAREFMKAIPSLVSGRIFALTSPYTFSAAISSVGYLKQAAPDRVTIVGEEVGDRLMFWAEGQPTRLPHTGGAVLIATQRHDYLNGCKTYSDCHQAVVRQPIAVPTLKPDIAAPWTVESYRAGKDPAMDAVTTVLANRHPNP